jgi:hypothetical protein
MNQKMEKEENKRREPAASNKKSKISWAAG